MPEQKSINEIWQLIRAEAEEVMLSETALIPYLSRCIIRHNSLDASLACVLSNELTAPHLQADTINQFIREALQDAPEILESAAADLSAHIERDPAAGGWLTPYLYFKGFHSVQSYRIAHWLWNNKRKHLARHIQARASQEYDVDIHPAATLGKGIMIDHATGVVIGETAVVEDDVSLLHGVTLGGTGKECGDRHPKIRRGVLIGTGAKILGNIEVGTGAKIGAASLVLESVAAHTTVAGVPAKVVGSPSVAAPALDMHHELD
jgi:serine O-acetyltransferase